MIKKVYICIMFLTGHIWRRSWQQSSWSWWHSNWRLLLDSRHRSVLWRYVFWLKEHWDVIRKKKRRNKEKFARGWKKKRWRNDGVLSRTTLIHALNLSTIHFNNYSRGRTVYSSNRPNFLNIYRRYETPLGETAVDLINARGVYLILGVQKGAFNRYKEAFKRERRFFSHVQ